MQSHDGVTRCSSCVAAPIPDGASGRCRAAASRQARRSPTRSLRELREETGLEGTCGAFVGWVERIGVDYHFVILDFEVEVVGDPIAGDDADEARWVAISSLDDHALVDGLARTSSATVA